MILRTRFRYWMPVLLWVGFVFWMSTPMFSDHNTYLIIEPLLRWLAASISHAQVLVFHTILRKLAHVFEYFITGTLLFRAFRAGSGERQSLRWAISSLLIVVLLAVGDEFHQSFLSTRTASIPDVGFDILGGILAQCVSVLRIYRHRK